MDERKEKFLEELAKVFTFGAAARATGVSIGTVYNWRSSDPVFREKCDAIREECIDLVEGNLYTRALQNGGMDSYFFLNGRRAEVYKGNKVQHEGGIKVIVEFEEMPKPGEKKE